VKREKGKGAGDKESSCSKYMERPMAKTGTSIEEREELGFSLLNLVPLIRKIGSASPPPSRLDSHSHLFSSVVIFPTFPF